MCTNILLGKKMRVKMGIDVPILSPCLPYLFFSASSALYPYYTVLPSVLEKSYTLLNLRKI